MQDEQRVLWACLAVLALQAQELETATVALAAIEEVRARASTRTTHLHMPALTHWRVCTGPSPARGGERAC